MAKLNEKNLVVHSNSFGNIIDRQMTVNQQKFLAIYISKLNPTDVTTRKVIFSLSDYEKIMNLKRFNITQIKETAKKMISMPVCIDQVDGGFTAVPTFKKFRLYENNDEWYVEIDCSDEVLPYLFNLHREFYKYELWNILRLSERNHQQMYRLLKQFEKTGERIIKIEDLKRALGLSRNQYPEFKEFNRRVIQGCQKALEQNTDIKFTYEPLKKRSVYAIKFNIFKNDNYVDQLELTEFLSNKDIHKSTKNIELTQFEFENETYEFLAEACENEFNEKEMAILFDLVVKVDISDSDRGTELERFDYLQRKYHEMDLRNPSKSRFGYLKKIISADIEL